MIRAMQSIAITTRPNVNHWPHRDGKGLSLILSVIPMNGQIVVRQSFPKQ
jgi:hypothetical protein